MPKVWSISNKDSPAWIVFPYVSVYYAANDTVCLEGGNVESRDHLPLLALRKPRRDKAELNQSCIWLQVWHRDSTCSCDLTQWKPA